MAVFATAYNPESWLRPHERYLPDISPAEKEPIDRHNAEMLHELLGEVVNDLEIGMVVVTHSRSLAARASQVLLLEGGRLSRTEVDEVVV